MTDYLGRRAVEGQVLAARVGRQQLSVVDIVRDVLREPAHVDVAELVAARERVDVDSARGGEPARSDVVGEDEERVLVPVVISANY